MNTQKFKKILGYRGYIFSRDINGNFIPQRVQNLVIKDFAARNDLFFKLSSTEYIMKDTYLMMFALLKELNSIDGVIFYSLEMLPRIKKHRNKFFSAFLEKKKKIYFALEELKVFKKADLLKIENFLSLKYSSMSHHTIKMNKSFFNKKFI